MALTFYWRCEGTTLDGTHDYSVGDTTATLVGGAAINSTAGLFGTNGLECPTNGDYAEFSISSHDLLRPAEGSIALGFRIVTWLAGCTLFRTQGTAANDHIRIEMSGTDEIAVFCRNSGTGTTTITSTDWNLSTSTTYFIIVRWHDTNNVFRAECYNSDGSARGTPVEFTSAFSTPVDLTVIRWGENVAFGTVNFHLDNLFCADTYAETLENNLTITSYTQYGGAAAGRGNQFMGFSGKFF